MRKAARASQAKHKAMSRVEQALDGELQEKFPSVTDPTGPRQPVSLRPRRKRA